MPCFPTHILALILFCFASLGHGAPSRTTVHDSGKTSEIRRQMQGFVDKAVIAGAVTLVAHNGKIIAHDAVGQADIAKEKAMEVDSLFWIASMTKPITATAVMMLQDEGKLNIEDPVEKYLPEFKNQWLVQNKTSNAITLVPAPRPITLRDLLTHTSGLGEVASPRPDSTLAELVMAYSQQPLKFAPGSKWEYGTQGWVDPQKRMIFVLMIQRTKFGNSDGSEVRRVFQETAVANFSR